MPKVRSIECSFVDIQKHLSVGRSRVTKVSNNIKQRTNLLSKIDEVMRMVQDITKEVISLAEDENLLQSSPDRAITNELDLIDKEAKKNEQKIDYRSAVRAMCNAMNPTEAKKIGLDYGIAEEQIKLLMTKAPVHTNLGKYISKLKPTPIPKPIPVEPPADEEEQSTIDSDDGEIDDKLKTLLGAK